MKNSDFSEDLTMRSIFIAFFVAIITFAFVGCAQRAQLPEVDDLSTMMKKQEDKINLLKKKIKHLKVRQSLGDDNVGNYNVISFRNLYNKAKQSPDSELYAIKLAFDQRFNIFSQGQLKLSTYYSGNGTYEFLGSGKKIVSSHEPYSFGHVLIVNERRKDGKDYFAQNAFGAVVRVSQYSKTGNVLYIGNISEIGSFFDISFISNKKINIYAVGKLYNRSNGIVGKIEEYSSPKFSTPVKESFNFTFISFALYKVLIVDPSTKKVLATIEYV
jgi:hypothetical protein